MRKLIDLFLLWWPLVRKSRYAQLQFTYDSARARVKDLTHEMWHLKLSNQDQQREMLMMQTRMMVLINNWTAGSEKRQLVREVLENSGDYTVFMKPIKTELKLTPDPSKLFQTRQVRLLDVHLSIGLTERTPPELVAEEISEAVVAYVLKQWRPQSLLLKKPGKP